MVALTSITEDKSGVCNCMVVDAGSVWANAVDTLNPSHLTSFACLVADVRIKENNIIVLVSQL